LGFVNTQNEPFIPEDARIRGDTEQQMADQIAVIGVGGQDGCHHNHAGTRRNLQTALEAKVVPGFRGTVSIRGLVQHIVEKDAPRSGSPEMAQRQWKDINDLHRILPFPALPHNGLPELIFDPPQILPLVHQRASIRQGGKPGRDSVSENTGQTRQYT